MTKLNPNQKKAVVTTDGRVLILAGAGSGKTRVLVHRIAHLIREKGVSPHEILGLTFTNKAAEEMRERVAKMVSNKEAKAIMLSTFHSFCMQILRKEIHRLGFTSRFSLYDERDMQRLISQSLDHIVEEESELESLTPVVNAIQEAKSKGLPTAELPTLDSDEETKLLKDGYEAMRMALRAYNALDFDSLLTLTVELFESHPDVLERYQDQYRYIMIDEYQDTNPIQYRLASLLSGKYQNLCVVGDDDQSIYAWRGAEIEHILNFPADTTIKLEHNYRSTSHILDAANAVIKHNTTRHDKQLIANQERGDTVEIFNAPGEDEEVEAVIARLMHLREKKGLRWRDMAILYRSNNLSRPFEIALTQTVWRGPDGFARGVPYQVFGGMPFYERSEVKDLMAYLRVIANPKDQEALLRILNYPRRGISDKTVDKLTQYNRSENIPLFTVIQEVTKDKHPNLQSHLSSRGLSALFTFKEVLREAKGRFETEPLNEALTWLLERIGYKKALYDEVKDERTAEFKWGNVEAFLVTLKQYGESETPSLEEFLSNTLLDSRKHKKKGEIEDKLNLMTFHSAKGLEFPAVFLVGLEDHLVPHEKSQTMKGIEEERRLLYVAITRAMKDLCISMARTRTRFGKKRSSNPSRFLFEIPKEILKVTPWKK